MEYLIAPLTVEGQLLCCGVDKMTSAVLGGTASANVGGGWNLYHIYPSPNDKPSNPLALSATEGDGKVTFGVCCATQIILEFEGYTEAENFGSDYYRIVVDGIEIAQEGSDGSEGPNPGEDDPDIWWAREYKDPVDHTHVIALTPKPCGNIIEIFGRTGDLYANNDVWWDVRVLSIT